MHPISRLALRFTVLTTISWFVMLLTHELGHVVGGWLGGGELKAAELRPWHLPYSIFEPDPHPLATLWSGLASGVLIPLGFAAIVRRNWASFIAGFCLLANGLYIAVGWWSGDPFLDTTKLLEHGAHPAWIAICCILTIASGYFMFRASCMKYLSKSIETNDASSSANTGV